jgi:gamma-glutamyltranspeptidase / glutathione hydrolase
MRWDLPYPSRRQPVLADEVVAASQPLAAQAGMAMFERGGNAVDAAIAAAACLTVVEPTNNGIGGDAFAIVDDRGSLAALNASGRSPRRLDEERLASAEQMPIHGWDAVTVPGAVSAWVALADRFGRLGLDTLLEPAIRYARDGWPVGPVTARGWQRAAEVLGGFTTFAEAFLPEGRAPAPGERFALPAQAETLRRIADTGGADFYHGRIAEQIAAHARATGGTLDGEDLAAHAAEWVDCCSTGFAGATLHELPPNGQGCAALIALGVLRHTDMEDHDPGSPEAMHLQIEAMKLALADAHAEIADPQAMRCSTTDLLDDRRLADLAGRIDPERAGDFGHGAPPPGGTVHLATADREGMAVSFIQSNYMGFGSGIVVPGTGISLQNRGAGFSTQSGHPNRVAPGKRPFHTIIPAFLRWPDGGDLAFGLMGGSMQAQGHVHLVVRIVLAGENPQAAVDAPRWRVEAGRRVALESGHSLALRNDLAARGHDLVDRPPERFGGAQLVQRRGDAWLGASDPRKEGQAVGR